MNLCRRARTPRVLEEECLVSVELLVSQELQGLIFFVYLFIHLSISLQTAPGQLFYPLWRILGIVVSFSGFYFSVVHVNNLISTTVLHLVLCLKSGTDQMGLQYYSSCSKGCSRSPECPRCLRVCGGIWVTSRDLGLQEHSHGVPRLGL